MHSLACVALSSLGLPDWIASVTYLALCLVFLCGSSNYVDLGWRQSQDTVHRNILHGTICGTDFDVALKQTWLPQWMHLLNTMQLQGWCLIYSKAAYEFPVNKFQFANHRKLNQSACMWARTTAMCTGKDKQFIYWFVMIGGPLGCFISFAYSFKSEKRSEEWQKDLVMFSKTHCAERRAIYTELYSLKRGFKATNRFLVPLAWDSGEKWSFVAVGHERVHRRRRSFLVGNCVGTTRTLHAVSAYLDGRWYR